MRFPGWIRSALIVIAITVCFSLIQTIIIRIEGHF